MVTLAAHGNFRPRAVAKQFLYRKFFFADAMPSHTAAERNKISSPELPCNRYKYSVEAFLRQVKKAKKRKKWEKTA